MQIAGTHEGSLTELDVLNILKAESGESLEDAGFKFYFSYFFQVQILQLPQISEGVRSEHDITIAVCYIEITDLAELHAEISRGEVEAL
jgi:hypothetical protein